MKVKSESEVARSCPTLCDPLDCSLPGSSIHGIFLARVLEWFVIPFPVDHVLSELFTVTRLSWVALHGMTHSFIELQKPLCCGKAVILLMVKDSENG